MVEYYTAPKKNESMPSTTECMDPEKVKWNTATIERQVPYVLVYMQKPRRDDCEQNSDHQALRIVRRAGWGAKAGLTSTCSVHI